MAQAASFGILLGRPWFYPSSVHVEYVLDEVARRQVFVQVLRVFSIITPPMAHTHLQLHVARTRTNGRGVGTSHKAVLIRKWGSIE
jgi:hypothetical protein